MKNCDKDNVPLEQRQKYPIHTKIILTKQRIKEWYEYYHGKVYVSFSGGKDSTVLLHIARTLYPEIKAVFCDTGLEFPEIKEFVKTFDNVTTIRPKIPFNKVIEKYGYPIVSKEQSKYIHVARNTKCEKYRDIKINGKLSNNGKYLFGKISNKWQYLIKAPFESSDKCCDIMKKNPFKKFEKENGLYPIIGVMASESKLREQTYKRYGCNAFEASRPMSRPLSFWTENDIYEYIGLNKLKICSVYSKGMENTGCMFCLYGYHMKSKIDRVLFIRDNYKNIYDYLLYKLNFIEILKWYPKRISDEEFIEKYIL